MSITVTITFGSIAGPFAQPVNLPKGSKARTETITTASDGTAASSMTCANDENVVWVDPDGDCYVAIGASPSTAANSDGTRNAHKVASGANRAFSAAEGDTVAIEAI